jgi:hypothetical protein
MDKHHPVIILVARPAAGKSEVIDYLKKTPLVERMERFGVAELAEFDDFLYIWEWFEEDDFLSANGRERLHSKPDYYFKDEFAWHVCIQKINNAFAKRMSSEKDFLARHTSLIEFARGGENGFRDAFSFLSDDILKLARIVYIKVPYEESVRKNKKRARKGEEHSVLYHSLPDDKMEFYYKVNDWEKLSGGKDQGLIEIKGHRVPFAVFDNMPEKTDDPAKLGPALDEVFARLAKTKS